VHAYGNNTDTTFILINPTLKQEADINVLLPIDEQSCPHSNQTGFQFMQVMHMLLKQTAEKAKLVKHCFSNAVTVMYSRNIPMAESVCFQSKKNVIFLFLTTIIYI